MSTTKNTPIYHSDLDMPQGDPEAILRTRANPSITTVVDRSASLQAETLPHRRDGDGQAPSAEKAVEVMVPDPVTRQDMVTISRTKLQEIISAEVSRAKMQAASKQFAVDVEETLAKIFESGYHVASAGKSTPFFHFLESALTEMIH